MVTHATYQTAHVIPSSLSRLRLHWYHAPSPFSLFPLSAQGLPSKGFESMCLAMRTLWELLLLVFISMFSKTIGGKPSSWFVPVETGYCMSWRVAVEAYNERAWRTVPVQCLRYVENYMLGGQYDQDINMVVEQICNYLRDVAPAADGKDAWILDIDDTCLSNLLYYQGKRFGVDPFDPAAFSNWVQSRSCPAIPAVHGLFWKLMNSGFKVFLLSGRDEETMGQATIDNLHNLGFLGYERLILRSPAYRGLGAVLFKSEARKKLVAEGYKIWGNVGDQWSDLLGDCTGDRTFKLPNPMYYVP